MSDWVQGVSIICLSVAVVIGGITQRKLIKQIIEQRQRIQAMETWIWLASAGSSAEAGRRLASIREDLIAQGVDPADLDIPLHPDDVEDS